MFIVGWSHRIELICICRSAPCFFAALHPAVFALLHALLSACTHKGPLASLLSLPDMFILLYCASGGRGGWGSCSCSHRCAARVPQPQAPARSSDISCIAYQVYCDVNVICRPMFYNRERPLRWTSDPTTAPPRSRESPVPLRLSGLRD